MSSVPIVNNDHPCNRRVIAHSLPTRVLQSEVANFAFAIPPYVGAYAAPSVAFLADWAMRDDAISPVTVASVAGLIIISP